MKKKSKKFKLKKKPITFKSKSNGAKLKKKPSRWLYLSPRILAILFILFISLFALDVFGEGYGFLGTILALLIHLIPTFILIIFLFIAWRLELAGGFIHITLAMFYIIWMWAKFPFMTYLIIPGTLFLIGILFLVNGFLKKR